MRVDIGVDALEIRQQVANSRIEAADGRTHAKSLRVDNNPSGPSTSTAKRAAGSATVLGFTFRFYARVW